MAKAPTGSKQKPDEVLVPAGATHFPTVDGTAGDPLPAGVTVRSGSGVQIEFKYQGKRRTETLRGRPTVAKVKDAAKLRDAVLTAIDKRVFSYETFFPESRVVSAARAAESQRKAEVAAVAAVTMNDLFTDFLARFIKDKPGSQGAHHTHKEVVKSHLRAAFGHLRPSELTADHIINWRDGLRDKVSVDRLSNVITPLRGAVKLALERDLIKRNPFDSVSPTKPKKQQTVKLDEQGLPSFDEALPHHTDRDYARAAEAADPFDAAEREAILGATKGQVRNINCFGFWTGLRTGELIALRWCDVDWDNQRILVRIAYSKKFFTPTKGKRMRWVPLLPPALEALRQQYQHTGEVGKWVFNNPVTHDRWSSSERLRRRWVRALKAAKVRYRYQYQMRHTYASARMSAGDSPLAIAEAMGHRDPRLVSVVYARFVPPVDQDPAARLAKAYGEEWTRVSALLADNADVVTAEDVAEDALPDAENGDGEEEDPVDRLDRRAD